ncbi:MAG: redoxin domain-containing protein [Acidimicrobiia bacterium]|nr:redoxin domain-containing protein [Acidimicrobiia bacterium]MDH5503448.1 redoxin domain-containing protein [Acidimicrobiia bacterium]
MGSVAVEMDSLGADLVGIAVTATFSQMAFAQQLGVGFALLSDWDGATSGAFGVRYDQWKGHVGLAKRSIFVIDGGGIIRYAWSTDDAEELPSLEPVVEAVRSLT